MVTAVMGNSSGDEHSDIRRNVLEDDLVQRLNNEIQSDNGDNTEGGTVMDLARQKVGDAIGVIKREVHLQREKSNSMCRLRTAHNWAEDKEKFKEDPSDTSFFMKAHTVTVLIFLICCLVYVGVIEQPIDDTSYNSRRGLMAALFFWVAAGMTIMPDGPFLRPHPSFWRFCFAVSIGKILSMLWV